MRKIENSGTAIFREHLFFLNYKSNVFEITNQVLGQIKPRLAFLSDWITFRKMASNKHVEWKKIKNFVKSKYYPEDISRDKERSKKGGYLSVIENF